MNCRSRCGSANMNAFVHLQKTTMRNVVEDMENDTTRFRRVLQTQADRAFEMSLSSSPDTCSYDEMRLEAAFRAWILELDRTDDPPTSLPSETSLTAIAADHDRRFGPDTWWTRPIWSSCWKCSLQQEVSCAACRKLSRFSQPHVRK